MKFYLARLGLTFGLAASAVLLTPHKADACVLIKGCSAGVGDGAVHVSYEGPGVAEVAGAAGNQLADFAWRLMDPCLAAAETRDYCSPTDVRSCPQQPDRIISYLVAQNRPVVNAAGLILIDPDEGRYEPAPSG